MRLPGGNEPSQFPVSPHFLDLSAPSVRSSRAREYFGRAAVFGVTLCLFATSFGLANGKISNTVSYFRDDEVAQNNIFQAGSASGTYNTIIPTSTYAAGPPNTLTTTGTQILAANYLGYFTYGENACTGTPSSGTGTPPGLAPRSLRRIACPPTPPGSPRSAPPAASRSAPGRRRRTAGPAAPRSAAPAGSSSAGG